ncbi:MAG: hypothetical protein R3C18_18730 [Planctomycetaceae bacterium]
MANPRDQFRISEASAAAERAANTGQRLEIELNGLKKQNQQLRLMCQALWELLRERAKFEDDALTSKMYDIQERQKSAQKQQIPCDDCGRDNAANRQRCLYCGAELEDYDPFA